MQFKLLFDDFGYSPAYVHGYRYVTVKGRVTSKSIAECINDAIIDYVRKMANKCKTPIECIEVYEWDMPRKKIKHGGKRLKFYRHKYQIVSLARKQVWGYYYSDRVM